MREISSKVAIIILNWNGLKDTKECLESLEKLTHPHYELIVVDNGSSDGSVEQLGALYPGVTLIANEKNLGYAGGNNVGVEYALKKQFEYLLILNNDTIVHPSLIEQFIKAHETLENAGILGGAVYDYDDPEKITCSSCMWDEAHCSFRNSSVVSIYSSGHYIPGWNEVDYVSGCVLFFSRSLIEKVGSFNEDFYLTFEETDLCFRVRELGFKCYYVPEAKIWHKGSVSFGGQKSPLYNYFMTRNKLLFLRKHVKKITLLKYLKEIVLLLFPALVYRPEDSLLRRLYWDLKIYKNTRHLLRARLIGIMDFFGNHFGDCPAIIRELNATSKGRIN